MQGAIGKSQSFPRSPQGISARRPSYPVIPACAKQTSHSMRTGGNLGLSRMAETEASRVGMHMNAERLDPSAPNACANSRKQERRLNRQATLFLILTASRWLGCGSRCRPLWLPRNRAPETYSVQIGSRLTEDERIAVLASRCKQCTRTSQAAIGQLAQSRYFPHDIGHSRRLTSWTPTSARADVCARLWGSFA